MKFIVLFEDNPAIGLDVRKMHMQQHLTFLEKNNQQIDTAGPLQSADGTAAGGLWIVNGESEEIAEELVRADPFWPTGLRQSYKIMRWSQVFADGKVLDLT